MRLWTRNVLHLAPAAWPLWAHGGKAEHPVLGLQHVAVTGLRDDLPHPAGHALRRRLKGWIASQIARLVRICIRVVQLVLIERVEDVLEVLSLQHPLLAGEALPLHFSKGLRLPLGFYGLQQRQHGAAVTWELTANGKAD